MSQKAKSVLSRFVKAFVAGAIGGLGTVTLGNVQNWSDLGSALVSIAFSLIVGGITGIIMAAEKYARWTDEPA